MNFSPIGGSTLFHLKAKPEGSKRREGEKENERGERISGERERQGERVRE